MAEYKLKPGQEAFRVVDGPFRCRLYEPGTVYQEIPPEESGRFEEILPAATTMKKKPAEEVREADQL